MRRKVVITGGAETAGEIAERVLERGLGDVVLFGEDHLSLSDISAATAISGRAGDISAGSWDAAAGADVVVIAGGDVAAAATGVAERCPGAVVIAEESTAWPGVTRPTHEGGLGFSYKWNMGWMHDTLHYIQREPLHRSWHHDEMTFGLVYAWSERFVLPISHDEVVYGKGSLLGKMPGDPWRRFANLRAYLGFMWTHPGKKLLFMGCELADPAEWNHDAAVPWALLDDPRHAGAQRLVRDLNAAYRAVPALHRLDCRPEGFRWVVGDDRAQSVFAYLRLGLGGDPPALVVCNLTPVPRHGYRLGLPRGGHWREVLNTDSGHYGGSDVGNLGGVLAEPMGWHSQPYSAEVTLPPLGALWLVPETD